MYQTRDDIPAFPFLEKMRKCGAIPSENSLRSRIRSLKPGQTLLIDIGDRAPRSLGAQVAREMSRLTLETNVVFHQRKMTVDGQRKIAVQVVPESEVAHG